MYVILGNGFSIDLIHRLGRVNDIDVKNLFSKGAEVPWPSSNNNGFLSYKHCSSLWTLGARTTMNTEESIKLIEDIITCVNVYNLSRLNNIQPQDNSNNIYIKAYGELTTYLRYLFIFYNSKINDDSLKEISIPFINYLKNALGKYEEIIIINYNYDIWLERLLSLKGLDFNIEGFEDRKEAKIKIIKPHGSISFSFKTKINGPFTIRNVEIEDITQDTSEFCIKYDLKDDYPIVNAIIPPAGDSNRVRMGWVKVLREITKKKIELAASKDKLMMFGISYWHVDRSEIDEILTSIDTSVEFNLINPNPPTCLDAVVTSLFKNYIHFKSSNLMEVNNT